MSHSQLTLHISIKRQKQTQEHFYNLHMRRKSIKMKILCFVCQFTNHTSKARVEIVMKLSNIIAKEIQLKHLNEGIKHTQIRNKYRNYKLKQHYQIPSCHPDRLYMYSNIQGNQFQFKKEHFDAVNFPNPLRIYQLLNEFQVEINKQIYQLWEKNKSYAKKEYFPLNRKLILWSIAIIWLISLIMSIGVQCFDQTSQPDLFVQAIIISAIVLMIVINIAALVKTNKAEYAFFQYDNEIVKLIASRLYQNRRMFQDEGLIVKCDREITWICFKVATNSSQSQYQSAEIASLAETSVIKQESPYDQ